jgi:hypothetical protein
VNPYLLASIHMQESGFSTNPTVASGVNAFGCCAGPMQFNVKAGTWDAHKFAFRPIADARPGSYPLDRRKGGSCGLRPPHKPSGMSCQAYQSCKSVPAEVGCVYDDFDAIAGAAHKLRADGATESLYSDGTHDAVCAYIGSCSEVDNCTGSVNQYCEVLTRAREWELKYGAALPTGPVELTKAERVFQPRRDVKIPVSYMAPGRSPARIDARIWPDVRYVLQEYDLRITAGKETGHLSHGDGSAIDAVPAGNNSSQPVWDRTAGRLARDLGWTRSCGSSGSRPACALVPAIEWVGYDGYPNHGSPATCGGGCPMHIHVSWVSSTHGTPFLTTPKWMLVFPVPGADS